MKGFRRRNSRWDDAPILDATGNPRIACITERDIEGICKPLARYRYLRADYIHAFAGGNFDYLVDRLNLLSRQPNRYIARPHQQRANAGANHRPLIYELADKGWRVLQERGATAQRSRAPSNFTHELMTCEVTSSFELGARQSGAQLITWHEILGSRSLPESTRHSAKPYAIPVKVTINRRCHAARVEADGQPFGIARQIEDRTVYFFCPGVEVDCGTEPIDASDFGRSSLYKKFALYLAIENEGIYRSHFGFPSFYVPIVTTNRARLASMMRLLERITDGRGSKIFLFKTLPAFTSFERPRPASGHMLTESWQRVAHADFNFLTS